MNPLPPNADDLVSAYLDAEATPDEIDVVESTPELMARVDSFRLVAGDLSEPLTPPAQQKEAHIAAALGAFDELLAGAVTEEADDGASAPSSSAVPTKTGPSSDTAESAEPVSLDAARDRRAARNPRRFNIGIIAAAAAALLLFVGLGVLSIGRGGQSDDVANSADAPIEASVAESMDDRAMDDRATDDDATDDGGLSEFGSDSEAIRQEDAASPAVQPTAEPFAAAEAAPADDAMDDADEAMDDAGEGEITAGADNGASDEAASDEAMDEDSDSLADTDLAKSNFFLGEFEQEEDLQLLVEELTADEIESRLAIAEELLFVRCADIAELEQATQPTLVGEGLLDGADIEVHRVDGARNSNSFIIVAVDGCDPISSFP